MTPPETPKPLTEKELNDMEAELNLLYETRGKEYKEWTWAGTHGFALIKEIKRLRAGPGQDV